MKKIFFCLIATVLVSSFSFSQDINKFNADPRLKELVKISSNFETLTIDKKEEITQSVNQIKNLVEQINSEYGAENVTKYIDENIKIKNDPNFNKFAGDGNKCKRNSNGTVNGDACDFWETLSYIFQAAMNCGATVDEYYYNCCQRIICKTC